LVEALETTVYFSDIISAGGMYMRHNSAGTDFEQYAALKADFTPIDNIQFFTEYAFNTSSAFAFEDEEVFAFYAGTNFYYGSFGGVFEFKNYNNFLLGNGFNDPPSLIKEHTYPVLNRSTHVLQTADEKGIQAEIYYNFEEGHSIVANYTSATNDLFRRFDYREYFLEGVYQANSKLTLKSFFDYANDDFKNEEHRISAGFIVDNTFDFSWNVILDLQYQTFERSTDTKDTQNYYSSISVAYLPDIVVSLILEATTDPQLTDNPTTFPEEESDTRYWLGGNASYQFNQSHTLDVFAGKRRGGPACTSGICYEILDFEGIELRFSTRF
ncbi:MAG: DUF6029 family protein, partial [Balneolales bacterium]|nr:DUF6029 family protein [Balneolales bacterium]